MKISKRFVDMCSFHKRLCSCFVLTKLLGTKCDFQKQELVDKDSKQKSIYFYGLLPNCMQKHSRNVNRGLISCS